MSDSHTQAPVRFLDGYTALDLTDLKGQLCGRFLGDLGMAVIKLEPPGGDPVRTLPPLIATADGGKLSLPFAHLNSNKKSLVLDLQKAEDQGRLKQLVRKVDVVLESFTPGFLDSIGLGFEQVSEINPGLVMCSVTGFGQTGPRNEHAISDIGVFAMSGLMHISGASDLPPCKPPETQAYYFGSLMGALGTVAALYQRQETGAGNHVDVSMQEALATQEHSIRVYANEHRTVARDGSQHASVAPARIFPCQDGHVYIYVSRRHWKILLEVWTDHPKELDDPDWVVDPFRRTRAETINEQVAGFTARYTKDALTTLLQGHGIPCVPVNRPEDFIADEQVEARQFFTGVGYAPGVTILQPQAPFLINGQRPELHPAPALDAHHDEMPAPTTASGPEMEHAQTRANEGAPLAGLRILSFDQVLAGPYGMMLLAELGAAVTKVESRRGGLDLFRFFGTSQDPNLSPRFLEFNRNKRSVTVNLKSAAGAGIVKDLARQSDVVMDNFSAHVMPSLGLDFEDLIKVKPDVITLRMPGLGSTGPKKDYATLGTNITAFTGFTYLWNHKGHTDPPVGSQIVLPDYVSGLIAAILLVSAVIHRNQTGHGAAIDLSQAEAASYLIGASLMQAMQTKDKPLPMGNTACCAAPHGCYPCKGHDRWCVIAVETDTQWRALAQEIGHDSRLQRFDRLDGRLQHQSELNTLIGEWTVQQDPHEVMTRLTKAGVPCGVVQDGADLVNDPHLIARGFIVEQTNPRLGRVVLPGCPIRFASYHREPIWEFPVLGRDNEEVFKDILGYSPEHLAQLERDGALE